MLLTDHKSFSWKVAKRILPLALIGVVAGVFLLGILSNTILLHLKVSEKLFKTGVSWLLLIAGILLLFR